MSGIETVSVAVTTAGAAGSAVGSATSAVISGFLLDVFLDYDASAPATTDVTIAYDAPDSGTIVAASNSATDALIAPRVGVVDAANAAITGATDRFPLNGRLTVSVAQSNALAPCVTARIRYLRV